MYIFFKKLIHLLVRQCSTVAVDRSATDNRSCQSGQSARRAVAPPPWQRTAGRKPPGFLTQEHR